MGHVWVLRLSPTTNGSLSAGARSAQYGSSLSPVFRVLLANAFIQRHCMLRLTFLDFSCSLPVSRRLKNQRRNTIFCFMTRPAPLHPQSRVSRYIEEVSIVSGFDLHFDPYSPIFETPPTFTNKTILLDFPMYDLVRKIGQVLSRRP